HGGAGRLRQTVGQPRPARAGPDRRIARRAGRIRRPSRHTRNYLSAGGHQNLGRRTRQSTTGGSGMITVERTVHFASGRRTRKVLREGESPSPVAVGRIPRVSRMMALAIRFDRLIQEGVAKDQAELARLGHVTRARLTQIMNLLYLAPDIQEDVLFLPPTVCGRDPIRERDLRPIAATANWKNQRKMWAYQTRILSSIAQN